MNRADLKMLLDQEGFDPQSYSLCGGQTSDQLCMSQERGGWVVYYTERGSRFDEQWFATESLAAADLLARLRRLPSSQTRIDPA